MHSKNNTRNAHGQPTHHTRNLMYIKRTRWPLPISTNGIWTITFKKIIMFALLVVAEAEFAAIYATIVFVLKPKFICTVFLYGYGVGYYVRVHQLRQNQSIRENNLWSNGWAHTRTVSCHIHVCRGFFSPRNLLAKSKRYDRTTTRTTTAKTERKYAIGFDRGASHANSQSVNDSRQMCTHTRSNCVAMVCVRACIFVMVLSQ